MPDIRDLAVSGEPFLQRIDHEIKRGILPALADKLELCYGRTGAQAVTLGAAALVLQQELGVV